MKWRDDNVVVRESAFTGNSGTAGLDAGAKRFRRRGDRVALEQMAEEKEIVEIQKTQAAACRTIRYNFGVSIHTVHRQDILTRA